MQLVNITSFKKTNFNQDFNQLTNYQHYYHEHSFPVL
jgi:hypothetical protein